MKYYEQQIAYLDVYIGYLEKGYKIARQGLTAISDIKKGEFSLHQAFFSSLVRVNPAIAKYAPIGDIISMQLSIASNFKNLMQQTSHFNAAEISYLKSVYTNLTQGCLKSLGDLTEILTDGSLTMTDNERLKRIDTIYGDMEDKNAFSQSFTGEAIVLAAGRADEQNELDFLNTLY